MQHLRTPHRLLGSCISDAANPFGGISVSDRSGEWAPRIFRLRFSLKRTGVCPLLLSHGVLSRLPFLVCAGIPWRCL